MPAPHSPSPCRLPLGSGSSSKEWSMNRRCAQSTFRLIGISDGMSGQFSATRKDDMVVGTEPDSHYTPEKNQSKNPTPLLGKVQKLFIAPPLCMATHATVRVYTHTHSSSMLCILAAIQTIFFHLFTT